MEAPFRIALALKADHIPASRDFFLGAHTYAHTRSDWKVLAQHRTTMLSWDDAFALKPDGVLGIITGGEMVPETAPEHPKVVILNNWPCPFQSVVADSFRAGRLAARYLLEHRLRHLAFVGYGHQYFSKLRLAGFLEELRVQRFQDRVPELEWMDHKDPFPQAPDWLRSLSRPCGVVCANDRVGRDIIIATLDAGLAVPEEIAVLGISNDRIICLESPVILSSVEQHYESVGFRGAAVLDELLRGRREVGEPVLIPPGEVIARESTRIFGVDDPLVRRALLIIHEERSEPLTMSQLLTRLGQVSQRTVTLRFRQVLGRSPYQEILHARVAQAQKLLRSTRTSLEEIATLAGFYDPAQFSRHFRKIAGLTPAQYRREQAN